MKNIQKERTYPQKITQKRRLELKAKIEASITAHKRMDGAYLWNPPTDASSRRNYERYYSFFTEFMYAGKPCSYMCDVNCSCKNIYVDRVFKIDGERVDVRAFKKMLKELDNAIDAYSEKYTEK